MPARAERLPDRAGIGLKTQHADAIIAARPDLGFLEIHAENYMGGGGPPHHRLAKLRERYALSVHGVGLSIGSESRLDETHLDRLATLLERYEPESFSEHLAWSSHGPVYLNDLLPVPYDGATLARVCAHVDRVQERLARRLLLENPSTYVAFATSTMSETDFLAEVVRRTGCALLLDLTNVHVSCVNHGLDAARYLESIPFDAVAEIHVAGYTVDRDAAGDPLLVDDHGSAVPETVWSLLALALARTGPLPVLVEWDNRVPALETLLAEAARVRAALEAAAPAAALRA